jgi:shikimate dehydrogenase
MPETIRLGLIGDNIALSQSPRLHRIAGEQCGRAVTYDRLVPRELGKTFDEVFDDCARGGYHGINVTYPYKEIAARKVKIEDDLVRSIGAVNTVLFKDGGALGFNTDYSGFAAAYRRTRGDVPPGSTCLIGAGGVGRAIAFSLVALGVEDLRIADRDLAKAESLAVALKAAKPGLHIRTGADAAALARGAEGLVNGTPVGMDGYPGTPLPRTAMGGALWAFDAVYTPVDTQFLRDATAEGLTAVSGYELFLGQGFDAWSIFTGLTIDMGRLRAALAQP